MPMKVKMGDFVANFKAFADKAVREAEIITVFCPKNGNVVVISEEEFAKYARAKRNMKYLEKLRRSKEDYKAGRVVVKSLDELHQME